MRKLLCASVLMLALCVPAFAGDISNPSTPQPPPSSVTAKEHATDGEMQNGTANSFTEMLLSVLENALISALTLP
jgi:hypothetical protein